MSNLPFWSDDLDCFYYLPDADYITFDDAITKYGINSSTIMQCKAWWNTNIPMDKYMPLLMPADPEKAGRKACLDIYIKRIQQRAEGKECPTPPELVVKAGILVLDRESKAIVGFISNHPLHDALRLMTITDISKMGYVNSFDPGETIQRDPDCVYWDMMEQRYV